MLKYLLMMATLLAGAWASAEWVSPHPTEMEQQAPAALLPFPAKVQWGEGRTELPAARGWELAGDAVKDPMVRTAWNALVRTAAGKGSGTLRCTLTLDNSLWSGDAIRSAEGYCLSIGSAGIDIRAAAPAGLFYGLQTLRQLAVGGTLPHCRIEDAPAFALRGFMHDCGRNFQSIDSLKRQLDLAAQLKLNTFHWHLTDHPGWRVECRAYPELNDPKHRTRDLQGTYSYKDIRELIDYARKRHIRIIPELDMPGHSAYFKRAFGFDMASEQGQEILEKLLEEFCAEIPAEDCPIVHLGADEVRIPNAKAFVKRMSDKLISLGRRPMQWGGPHDLPVGEDSIAQRWAEGAASAERSLRPESIHCRTVDSSMGYSNLFEPSLLVRRYFFMRPCGVERGDELRLGLIACIWPDTRVDDKSKIERHNGVWPVLCAAAERSWCGAPPDGDALALTLPRYDTAAGRAYSLFEQRLDKLRCTLFRGTDFPFHPEYGVEWTLTQPVPTEQAESMRQQVLAGTWDKRSGLTRRGACLYLRTRPATANIGVFRETKPGVTVWAQTTIRSPKEGMQPFLIGFDAPARSSRRWSGVAPRGEWSSCGTRIWVNGQELKNPQTYRLAGQGRCVRDTWFALANENPLDDEEVWWAHEPTLLPLRRGANTIVVEQPYIGDFQSWEINLVPLFRASESSE